MSIATEHKKSFLRVFKDHAGKQPMGSDIQWAGVWPPPASMCLIFERAGAVSVTDPQPRFRLVKVMTPDQLDAGVRRAFAQTGHRIFEVRRRAFDESDGLRAAVYSPDL